eukprot:g32253.t1
MVKENPKALYAYIRRKRVAKKRVGPLKNKGGMLCIEPQEVGEILNEYFVLVFTEEKDMTDVEVRDEYVNTLKNVSILKEEVLGILNCIKVKFWRLANVVPSFKKGNRDNPANHRLVSLTSVVEKFLEKILRDKIYEHLEENGLVSDQQH